MFSISIALMIVGMIFLFAESITPGFGVFGASGIVLLVVSAVLTLFYVRYGFIMVCCEIGVLGVGVWLFIRRMKSKKNYGQLFLNETLNEDAASKIDLSVYLGKTGAAKTSLRPAGVAEIDGASVEVVSDGAYIPENTPVYAKEIVAGKLVVVRVTV